MSDSEKDGGKRSRWKKHGRKVVILLGITVLLFVGWRVWASYRVNAKLAALRAAGYPVTMSELEKMYYPQIKAEDNAAEFYEQTFRLLKTPSSAGTNSHDWFLLDQSRNAPPFSEVETAEIKEFLANNKEALERLRNRSTPRACRYPHDFTLNLDMPMPEFSGVSYSTRLLTLDAIMAAENGESARVIENLMAVLRVSKSIANEPFSIALRNRYRFRAMMFFCLPHILDNVRLTDEQLASLAEVFGVDDTPGNFERMLAGERCSYIGFFQMPPVDRRAVYFGESYNILGDRLMVYSGLMDLDLLFYLKNMDEHFRIAKLPFPERLDQAQALEEYIHDFAHGDHIVRVHELSSMCLLGLGSTHRMECMNTARLSIIVTGLAIERHRLAHGGNLPDNLTDLVPAFLPSAPRDPFDGAALRYRKISSQGRPGFVVYSVGEDRKDDNGAVGDPKISGSPKDVVFSVER